MVLLTSQEQEYLLHAVEAAAPMAELRQFFLWSQGALQALLPHRVLLCVWADGQGTPRHVECLHSTVLPAPARDSLCDIRAGLGHQLWQASQQADALPLALAGGLRGLDALRGELSAHGLAPALLHGSGATAGGGSAFCLLGMPAPATARDAWLLQLLLPPMHLALQRLAARPAGASGWPAAVSPRQQQILHWLREGKNNDEIGALLGISPLTVKNHLQRLYRQLGVNNRAHAVARCAAACD